MSAVQRNLAALAALCLVAGCEPYAQKETPEQAEEVPQQQQRQCDPANTRGTVALQIAGNPNDTFRISLLCGGQVVSSCTATVPAAGNVARCNAGPNPVPAGAFQCLVGPGNANSAAARVVGSICG